jgi:hypothetical protein
MGSQTFVDGELPQQDAMSFVDLVYETADGYITVAVQSDREWGALTRAFDRPEWLGDPRFATPASRQKHIDDRLAMIQDVLRTGTTAHWLARLEAEDVPCAPVLTRTQVIAHPQLHANATIVETVHHAAGRLRQSRPAARFSRTPAAIRHGAPGLGEHTRDVLREAGLDDGEIAALDAAGVFGTANGRAPSDPASRARAAPSILQIREVERQPVDDCGRLVGALELQHMVGLDEEAVLAALLEAGQRDAVAQFRPGQHGHEIARPVDAVIEPVGRISRQPAIFVAEIDDEARDEEALHDGAAERAFALRALHVHMHPVRVARRLREPVHHLLGNREPVGEGNLLADVIGHVRKGERVHGSRPSAAA